MVVCTNHLLKGFVAGGGDEGLVGKPMEFIFGDLGVTAGHMQMLKAAAISPWALKPVIALISDGMPIFGYKKKPYVVITTVIAFAAALLMGFGVISSVPAIVACLFLIFLQVSSVDLLLQAKQSEEVKQNSKLGPQFFTFTWLGINAGQIGSVVLLGPMIHHFGPRLPFLIAAPFIALVLWPTLSNFLGEKPVPVEERGLNFKIVKTHPELCGLTIMIGTLIVALIFGTFFLTEFQIIALAMVFAILVLAGFLTFIRHEITGPIIFYFLLGMLSFNVDGALFYFYTDTAAEFPEGPQFTAYFYTTALGLLSFVGIMVGFMTGDEIFKGWSYRGILKITILLRCLTQLAMVPLFLRWNVRLGIPDSVWVLAVTMSDTIVFAWRWIPKQVMGAHLTPQGVEATMLGLSAGTFNMAMILSSYIGGFLLNRHGVTPSGQVGESHVFANLWKVQTLAAFAPLLMLFLLPALVPNCAQTEPLITERRDSATHNSLFERMRRN
jgi:MFS family permease